MKNKVSVITTVRNEENNINFLIDSILKQNYKFQEFVINDNSSTDNTVAIIERYSLLDNRIKIVKSGNLSIGEGRNAAISWAPKTSRLGNVTHFGVHNTVPPINVNSYLFLSGCNSAIR